MCDEFRMINSPPTISHVDPTNSKLNSTSRRIIWLQRGYFLPFHFFPKCALYRLHRQSSTSNGPAPCSKLKCKVEMTYFLTLRPYYKYTLNNKILFPVFFRCHFHLLPKCPVHSAAAVIKITLNLYVKNVNKMKFFAMKRCSYGGTANKKMMMHKHMPGHCCQQ